MIILDVGYSMNQPYTHLKEKSRIDIGIESIKLLVQQKVIYLCLSLPEYNICLALVSEIT